MDLLFAIASMTHAALPGGESGALIHVAYLDLGTGSFVLQILAASALSAAVAFRRFRGYITYMVMKPFRKKRLTALDATTESLPPPSPGGSGPTS